MAEIFVTHFTCPHVGCYHEISRRSAVNYHFTACCAVKNATSSLLVHLPLNQSSLNTCSIKRSIQDISSLYLKSCIFPLLDLYLQSPFHRSSRIPSLKYEQDRLFTHSSHTLHITNYVSFNPRIPSLNLRGFHGQNA